MKKYNYIDLVKTLAMFLVIAVHCALFYGGNQYWLVNAEQDSIPCRWISNTILVSAVPIFVFCAGFLLQLSLQKKNISIVNLIKKKAVRLLIPYYVFGALWLVPTYTFLDIPSYGRNVGDSLIDGYKAMFLGVFTDLAWFLLMLFWVTTIWILLSRLLEKRSLIYGTVAAVVMYFIAHFCLMRVDYFKLSQIDIYIPVFFVGAAFFYVADYIYDAIPKWILIIGSLSGIIVCVFLAQLSTEVYVIDCILKIVSPVLFLTCSMGLCHTNAIKKLEKTFAYNWLRRNSMYIYLLQAPGVYIVFRKLYPIIGSNAVFCFFMMFILTTLLDIVLTWIYVLIRKKLLQLVCTNRFLASRKN